MTDEAKADKTREFNERTEKGIIADMLGGNLAFYMDAKLTPDYFGKFKKEVSYIMSIYANYGGKPSALTFKATFPAFEIPTDYDPPAMMLKAIRKKYIFQQSFPIVNELNKDMEKGDVDQGIEKFVASLQKIHGVTDNKVINVYRDVDIRYRHYEELRANPEKYITYGFPEWDTMLGGLGRADLVVIAGRAGEGKSICAIKMGMAQSLAGYRVAYFNGEMDEDEIGYRVDTLMTGISNYGMAQGKEYVAEKYASAVVHIRETKATTGEDAVFLILSKNEMDDKITPKYLEKFCRQNNIDVLIIDQFSLLDSVSKMRQDSEISYELSRDIKHMQKSLKIPVVLLAQIKRQDKKQQAARKEGAPKYELSDLSKTRGLEEFASVVILLDNQYERDYRGWAVINFFFGKSRGSKARGNTLTYAWDIDKGNIEFLKSTQPLAYAPTSTPERPKAPPPQGKLVEADEHGLVPVSDENLPF
jgi:replicative DNA helicase